MRRRRRADDDREDAKRRARPLSPESAGPAEWLGAVVGSRSAVSALHRGVIVWNRSRKRDTWGQHKAKDRPEAEWLRIPAESLRIVSADAWDAAHERLGNARRRYLRVNGGRILGRPPAVGTKYLLSGMLTCGTCGSSLEARTRSHGRQRAPFYGCAAHHRKGVTVCNNNLEIPMAEADDAVLSTIERVMLDPSVVQDIVARAAAELAEETTETRRGALEQERTTVEKEIGRLIEALATGGELAPLLAAIRARETKRAELTAAIDQCGRQVAHARFEGAPDCAGGTRTRLASVAQEARGTGPAAATPLDRGATHADAGT